ncbi:hypothetical protein DL93DRAFT_2169032 [Clavulina sp. PMI_390]|nr:hypothetical protein DL93DRAFT_2169032 [Clavulina sp. PMI_390]
MNVKAEDLIFSITSSKLRKEIWHWFGAVEIAELFPHTEVFTVDISPVRPQSWHPKNVSFRVGNVHHRLPFDDGYFDIVNIRIAPDFPNLRHLAISSLDPGGFSCVLPFLQEVSSVVHLRVYHWMWNDVVSLVRALTLKVSTIKGAAASPSQFDTSLLPFLRLFRMIHIRDNGYARSWILPQYMEVLLNMNDNRSAFKDLPLARPGLASDMLVMKLNGAAVEQAEMREMEREYTSLDRKVAEISPFPSNQFDWVTPPNRDRHSPLFLT